MFIASIVSSVIPLYYDDARISQLCYEAIVAAVVSLVVSYHVHTYKGYEHTNCDDERIHLTLSLAPTLS
jgi:hypothetical protein